MPPTLTTPTCNPKPVWSESTDSTALTSRWWHAWIRAAPFMFTTRDVNLKVRLWDLVLSFKMVLNEKFSKCSSILIVRQHDSVLFIVVSPLVPYVKIRLLCLSLQSAVTHVLRISLGSQAAALISACWVTATRAEPAAAVLVLAWAVTESPARVSKISIQPAQTSFKQCYTTAFPIIGLSCI